MPLREYKLVVLGYGGVGKSAVTVRYVQQFFIERYDPTIEDAYTVHKELDGDQVVLQILDTAGTEQFTAMRDMYMKSGEGFIIIYSITSRSTFEALDDLIKQLFLVKDTDSVPAILLGNKEDLADYREVATQKGEEMAMKYGINFSECSAKTGHNIDEAFQTVVRQIIQKSPKVSSNKGKKKGCMIL
eukprot:TRINITY_DN2501_c0_g1_i1.p1 TRINITY_DN2501_c0_g1~~TRINITY_DN2501_c0_g1_i1.p1  ORF type:complete len:187 (+),score=68.71 TRINITY_DN2501_c0_g1_i1:104-664(+)